MTNYKLGKWDLTKLATDPKDAAFKNKIQHVEKIKVKDEEVDNNIKEMKKHYKDDHAAIERVSSPEYKNYVINVLTSRKVVDKLREWNVDK